MIYDIRTKRLKAVSEEMKIFWRIKVEVINFDMCKYKHFSFARSSVFSHRLKK